MAYLGPSGRHRRVTGGSAWGVRRRRRALLGAVAAFLGVLLYLHAHDRPIDDFRSTELDVVGVALKPSCVSRAAVRALNKHMRPRSIHIISGTPAQCAVFERESLPQIPILSHTTVSDPHSLGVQSFALNVRCHLEDSILPGVSKASVAARLEARFGAAIGASSHGGRQLAGWYLQQFLKLGAAVSLPSLGTYYVVWDMDMILLRAPSLWGSAPCMDDDSAPRKMVVNIGGAVARGYEIAYRNLFGQNLRYALDGSSFVTHWMTVYKPHMIQFLGSLGNTSAPDTWASRIITAVDPSHLNLGFSEYASYISWVQQHYPESQAVAHSRTWLRQGLGGERVVRLLRRFSRGARCCPWGLHMWLTRLLGYQYTGYEVGHIPECRYSDPLHAAGYGV